jgi:hypothetical protein
LRLLDPTVKDAGIRGADEEVLQPEKKGDGAMRMRLLRENDDPKLLSDIERLAGREPAPIEDVVAEDGVDAAGAEGAGVVEPGPLDDPFVRRFVQISVHLKRYAPFYAGAAVWALAMLLIQPVGGDGASSEVAGGVGFAGSSSVAVATASADSAVADLNADAIGAPVFDNTINAGAFSSADSAFADFTESEFAAGNDDSSDSATTSPTFDEETITFDDTEFADEEPEGLTILSSGYASRTGGTPAEQNPANGALPVAATLGNDTKYSFIELSGKGTVLRLKESPDGAVAADTAVLKACIATTAWKPERGQAFDAGPKFDPACSTGARFDGVWSFDLTNFPAAELKKGLVLTPAAGTALTFQVNLEPFALADGGA